MVSLIRRLLLAAGILPSMARAPNDMPLAKGGGTSDRQILLRARVVAERCRMFKASARNNRSRASEGVAARKGVGSECVGPFLVLILFFRVRFPPPKTWWSALRFAC